MARILVVDDELSMREFLEILLRQGGAPVLTAGDVAGALAQFREGEPDLVVSDLRLGREIGTRRAARP